MATSPQWFHLNVLAAGAGRSILHRELSHGKPQEARGTGPVGPSPVGALQQQCRQLFSLPEVSCPKRLHDCQFIVHAVFVS